MVDLTPSPYKLFSAFWIIAGFWLIGKLYWMTIYQWRYGEDYGERYITGKISKEEKERLRR